MIRSVENNNHSVTCMPKLGMTKATRATAIALRPIIKATKATGKTASVKQRTEPAMIQSKTGFMFAMRNLSVKE
jgi:hypothetical protein